jgi:hypothetical protein
VLADGDDSGGSWPATLGRAGMAGRRPATARGRGDTRAWAAGGTRERGGMAQRRAGGRSSGGNGAQACWRQFRA